MPCRHGCPARVPATQRAYRKEAETPDLLGDRRARAARLSSLTTERRDRLPGVFCVGRRRASAGWAACARAPRRTGGPSPVVCRPVQPPTRCRCSAAMFRWLIEQRYLLANPVCRHQGAWPTPLTPLDTSRGFTEANGCSCARLLTDLNGRTAGRSPRRNGCASCSTSAYATGLRASELVGARSATSHNRARGDHWLSICRQREQARARSRCHRWPALPSTAIWSQRQAAGHAGPLGSRDARSSLASTRTW